MFIVNDISKFFGPEPIIDGATLHIMYGDRVGIVGSNGCGKSTLLGIIAGETEPDRGSARIEKGTRMGFLHQEITREYSGSAMDYLLSHVRGLADMEQEKMELMGRLEKSTEADGAHEDGAESDRLIEEIAGLEERFHMEGGYNIRHEARKILAGLGFSPEDQEKEVGALSGGWRMRLELARLLLEEPDALLLDEPTNHLDIDSMKWLERYMEGFGGSLVVVSHDRRFLDKTVTSIAAIEDGKVRLLRGDYDSYKEVREMEIDHRWKQYNQQQTKIKEIKDFIVRNKVRKDRARVVQGRIKMLERMDIIEPPKGRKFVNIRFPQPERTGTPAIAMQELAKAYDAKPVFSGLNLSILRGEKAALVGPNGSGKTTLLKIMAGELEPTSGRVSRGSNVSVHYYAQHQLDALSGSLTVLEEMTSIAQGETIQGIRDVLGAFLFSSEDDVKKKVRVLSGGEKSRLALAKMMLRPAGLILMDEPTNHLDIESREILERALRQFEGTLVFVSHDRVFINALATRVIEISGGLLTDYAGDYDYYEWKKSGAEPEDELGPKWQKARGVGEKKRNEVKQNGKPTRKGKKKKDKKRKRTEAEQRQDLYRSLKPMQDEMISLENEIEELEKQQKELERQLASGDTYRDADKVKALGRERGDKARLIKELFGRWEELNRTIETMMAGREKE